MSRTVEDTHLFRAVLHSSAGASPGPSLLLLVSLSAALAHLERERPDRRAFLRGDPLGRVPAAEQEGLQALGLPREQGRLRVEARGILAPTGQWTLSTKRETKKFKKQMQKDPQQTRNKSINKQQGSSSLVQASQKKGESI